MNAAEEALRAIDRFRTLNYKGWDSYRGEPISLVTIERAKALVQSLAGLDCLGFNPAPWGDGSIGFEICWADGRELWIVLEADESVSMYVPRPADWKDRE